MSSKRTVRRAPVCQPEDISIRHISLTQGQVAIVDAADYDWLTQWNWCAHWNKDTETFYARRRSGNGLIGMHTAILNAPAGFMPDHIDGDTLNNRRGNLRIASHKQNQQNKGAQVNSQTSLRGIYPHRNTGRFVAQITRSGKKKHIGVFDTREAAIAARDTETQSLPGDYYRLSKLSPQP